MAEPEKRAASDPLAGLKEQDYDKYFTKSPEPWAALGSLEYGSDQSLAGTVETEVLTAGIARRAELEKKLLRALSESSGHPAAMAMICRLLALVGSEACALPLKAFLEDPLTSDPARTALESIPGEAVAKVLRDSLSQLPADKVAGLIGTIAARRDSQAAPGLQQIADDATRPGFVRTAAQRALEALKA